MDICVCVCIYLYLYIRLHWCLIWQRICLQCRRPGFNPWVWKIPWTRKWQPTPLFLPGELHGQRNLVGYSPWSHKELDMTERLTLSHFFSQKILYHLLHIIERSDWSCIMCSAQCLAHVNAIAINKVLTTFIQPLGTIYGYCITTVTFFLEEKHFIDIWKSKGL